MKSVFLHEMTRPAFQEWLASEKHPVVLLAVGSLEQHGPHLPLGTDSFAALALCREVAQRTNSVVVHPCWPGYSPHHMGFPGTLTLSEDTMVAVLTDVIAGLVHHGIKKIMLINAHGGNAQIVAYVARMAKRKTGATVVTPPMRGPAGDPAEAARTALKLLDVHSGAGETGLALAFFPEYVEMDRVKGFTPTAKVPDKVRHLWDSAREDVVTATAVAMNYVPDTHEFTSSGVYGWSDPNQADPVKSREQVMADVEELVKFVKLWKTVDE